MSNARKPRRQNRATLSEKVWSFHLSNGEFFALVRFTQDQVARFFPEARVNKRKATVYL